MRERYEGWLAQHGAESSRAVAWVDPALQALRFDLLAQVMEGDEPVTVAVFGCGTGALFAHLSARADPPPPGGRIGYDLVPAMVEAARGLHTDPRARFEVGTEVSEEVQLRHGLRRVLDPRRHRGRRLGGAHPPRAARAVGARAAGSASTSSRTARRSSSR